MSDPCNIATLHSEYVHFRPLQDREILAAMVIDHEWTEEAAAEVLDLARSKGAFLLRNALAMAIALGIEDGEQGY